MMVVTFLREPATPMALADRDDIVRFWYGDAMNTGQKRRIGLE